MKILQTTVAQLSVEIEDTGAKFRFRLKLVKNDKTTEYSRWSVSYTDVVQLNGMCAATEYYLPKNLALTPVSCEQFVKTAWDKN